jgi:exosortase/archaeosortase family protein
LPSLFRRQGRQGEDRKSVREEEEKARDAAQEREGSMEANAGKRRKQFALKIAGYEARFLFGKAEGEKALRFVGALAVIFVVLNYLMSLPLMWVEYAIANIVSFVLLLFGIENAVASGEPALILIHNMELPVGISYLCTGILESALIAAAIAASFGIARGKRIVGIAVALAAVQALNLTRILGTVFLTLNFSSGVAEIGHEVLFRIFLFAAIAGIYALWFFWATGGRRKQ